MGHRAEVGAGVTDADLSGTTALVTGSTDGVGRETALALGRLGARVFVHGRDRGKGAAVVDRLEASGADADFLAADFASLDAVRDLADAVADRVDRLSVLVNNAGAHFRRGALTDDGVERTMAVNHFAPFLLTNRLLSVVPPDGRIATVSSAVHRRADLDFDRFRSVEGYDGFDAYGRSKLANVLFTRELARRVEPAANALHPGFVPGSALWRDSPAWIKLPMRLLRHLPAPLVRAVAETPASGAETPVYLAAADVYVTGEYFVDCEPRRPSARARDDDLARRLWDVSEELTGLDEERTPAADP